MTWHNLPCAPTLPALFAACPNGWAEISITSHPGNPTADPPQDADSSIEVGRVYGVEEADLYLLHELAGDIIGEPPFGLPSDCTALVRFTYGNHACVACGRPKNAGEDWTCSAPGCDGMYMVPVKADLAWGPDKTIPHWIGEDAPVYVADSRRDTIAAYLQRRAGRWLAMAQQALDDGVVHVAERFGGAARLTADAVRDIQADVDLMDAKDTGLPEATAADQRRARIEDWLASEASAGRWNPEPPPQPGIGDMWQQVIDRYVGNYEPDEPMVRVLDIFRKRREMGLAKYKTPLQAGNGRNPLRDLLDETLDRIVYIEQAITEVPGRAASLRTEQDNDVELVEVLLGMQGFEDTGEECRAKYLRSIGETKPASADDEPLLCDFCKKPYESTRAHRLGLCVG